MNFTGALQTRPPEPTPPAAGGRRRWRWVALAVALTVAVGGFGVWWFVLRHDSPEVVSLDNALAGVTAPAQPAAPSPGAAAGDSPVTTGTPATAASAVAGTWNLDRTITNAEGTGSFAGFRVEEVLVGIGGTTAVGRSTAVDGTLTVDGTTLTAARIAVDLRSITTNDRRRDDNVQQALATSRFPQATFVLTERVAVASVPPEGQRINVKATGDLTIRGVTKSVTVDLQAQLQNGVLVVVGSAPVTFADFGVRAPTAPVVASVEDHGVMEFQLYFTRS